jgi:hypothetical protein
MWQIDWTDDFERWITSDQEVDEEARIDIRASLLVLREIGPALGRPRVDTLKGSRHANHEGIAGPEQGQAFPNPLRL